MLHVSLTLDKGREGRDTVADKVVCLSQQNEVELWEVWREVVGLDLREGRRERGREEREGGRNEDRGGEAIIRI